ncbi:MAG: DUF362 domain-containing protein [Bacteroidales bacterium]|nr:MAG: DUF362 domain-containing protein [Bacteroidales bacterium]
MTSKNSYRKKKSEHQEKQITRRDFISLSGMATAGLVMAGCSRSGKSPTSASTDKKHKVAIAKTDSYDRGILSREVRNMFDELGGLGDIIKPGSRVAIKVNLTGGLKFSGEMAKVGINAHWTHPEMVRAVCEALIDAGAKELFIMDGLYEDTTYEFAGYNEIADAFGARLINLNDPSPYDEFFHQNTGEGWYVYEEFIFNRLISEVDAFVSIPKMKCHNNCGVTLTLKNHIGLAPVRHYCSDARPDIRSAMHGTGEEVRTRLSKVIVDLVRARPIDLSVIDGIKTAEGGEGPWIENTFGLVEPGIIVAGKNPVATDSVATAVMGFNPDAAAFETPFVSSDNHLALASENDLGTNRLEEIEVLGAKIEDVAFPFKPCAKGGYIISEDT